MALENISIYAQNARLKKRVAALRKLLDEEREKNSRLLSELATIDDNRRTE